MLVHSHMANSPKPSGPRDLVPSDDNLPRAKKPKVKTGCLTCKVRRVKCDEAKPNCLRCIRFGVDCDGYPATNRPAAVIASRTLLPKDQHTKLDTLDVPKILGIYSEPRFKDEREGRCFQFFCEETASQIAGPDQMMLWGQLIPQACEAAPFVKSAVIAIAAMSKIKTGTVASHQVRGLYEFALDQYSRCLQGMRRCAASGKHEMRNVLLACILVFCFETMQGNPGAASTHARTAMMLMHRWTEEEPEIRLHFYKIEDWPKCQISSDIMGALAQLDVQITFLRDGRPEWIHRNAIRESNKAISKMPERIVSLADVRKYCCLLYRRNCRFISLGLERSGTKELCGPWEEGSEEAFEGLTALCPLESVLCTANHPVPEYEAEALAYREDMYRFMHSTTQLFKRLREHGSPQEKFLAQITEIHILLNDTMLGGFSFTSEADWDQFIPEFKKILELAQICHPYLIAPLKGSTLYRFDLGILTGLSIVALRCRHRPTRYAAFALLRSVHYREGVFDSHLIAMIGSWLAGIEERGMDENGYIPAHERVFITGIVVDLPNRKALMGCTQRSLNGPVFTKSVQTW